MSTPRICPSCNNYLFDDESPKCVCANNLVPEPAQVACSLHEVAGRRKWWRVEIMNNEGEWIGTGEKFKSLHEAHDEFDSWKGLRPAAVVEVVAKETTVMRHNGEHSNTAP
jgi:hypothetical protein